MNISQREKLYLLAGGICAVALLFYIFAVGPGLERMELLDRMIVQKKSDLKEILRLRNEYLEQAELVKTANKNLSKEDQGFPIFSFLEDLANKSGIKGNILYMKPSNSKVEEMYKESSVEMKLQGINLGQLLDYLYRIESSGKLLKVKKLRIKPRFDSPWIIEVTLQVSTFYLI